MIECNANTDHQKRLWTTEGGLICPKLHKFRLGVVRCPYCRDAEDVRYDKNKPATYTDEGYKDQPQRSQCAEGLQTDTWPSESNGRAAVMDALGNSIRHKKKHRSERHRRQIDDENSAQWQRYWNAGFTHSDGTSRTGDSWAKMMELAAKGLSADNRTPPMG